MSHPGFNYYFSNSKMRESALTYASNADFIRASFFSRSDAITAKDRLASRVSPLNRGRTVSWLRSRRKIMQCAIFIHNNKLSPHKFSIAHILFASSHKTSTTKLFIVNPFRSAFSSFEALSIFLSHSSPFISSFRVP